MIESTNLKMLRNLEAFQVFSDILAFLQEEESVEEPLQGLHLRRVCRITTQPLFLNAAAVIRLSWPVLTGSAIMYSVVLPPS